MDLNFFILDIYTKNLDPSIYFVGVCEREKTDNFFIKCMGHYLLKKQVVRFHPHTIFILFQ